MGKKYISYWVKPEIGVGGAVNLLKAAEATDGRLQGQAAKLLEVV